MKGFQKVIKYVAIAFGLYLAISIIGAIVVGVLAITTGMYGISLISDQTQIERIDSEKVLEQFSKIDLEINTSNIIIKAEGNEYKIETYQVPKTIEIKNNDGKLEIKDIKKITIAQESKIIIYVPKETVLDEFELDMGAGIVEIQNINSNKIDFSFGAGSVNIKNIVASNAEIECGAGQVIIEDANLTNTKLDTGVGKLVYSGQMKGNSKINCGIGEVQLKLVGGNEIYTIDAEKGIGDIKINGNKIDNESIIGNGEHKISINGGIGSINIEM